MEDRKKKKHDNWSESWTVRINKVGQKEKVGSEEFISSTERKMKEFRTERDLQITILSYLLNLSSTDRKIERVNSLYNTTNHLSFLSPKLK